MLLLWHCLTAALPTVNCLHVFMDRARQKQLTAVLENEGFSWQVRTVAFQIHGGHLLHRQEVTDCMCLPRFLLCLFQVTPDLEVLSPRRERMGARKGCYLQACLQRATLVASGCWQRVSYKPCPSLPPASSDGKLPSPLPSLSTGSCMLHTPSSAECSVQTTEPLCSLRAGMRTSLGSATKINLKPLGERAARALEKVKAVPMQGILKQIFTVQASSLLRLVLPYVFWHMQLCCCPALESRMPEISSAELQ